MKRLGALVVAAGLIFGAIRLSDAIYGDDSTASAADGDEVLRVRCADEFAAACRALSRNSELAGVADFTTEDAGTTAAQLLADPTPSFDLWITSNPWPDLVAVRADAADARRPELGEASDGLAATPLSMVATTAKAAELEAACTTVSGSCLLRTSDRLGSRRPTTTAGLLAVGALINGWPDLAEPDTVSIETDDTFLSAFSGAKRRTLTDSTPVATILTQPKFQFALDLAAQAQLDAAANGSNYTAIPTGVVAVAVAVPADTTTGKGALDRLGADRVTAAITAQGWSDDIPTDDGLPDPAVLDYLVTKWTTT